MPAPGQEETVRIVALDRDFHVHCYRCEVCGKCSHTLSVHSRHWRGSAELGFHKNSSYSICKAYAHRTWVPVLTGLEF